jgi:hypothetical protein
MIYRIKGLSGWQLLPQDTLCNLCALCVFVVKHFYREAFAFFAPFAVKKSALHFYHKGTKGTRVAQRFFPAVNRKLKTAS